MCNFPPPPPFFPNHLTNYSKTWAYDGKNVESVAYFLNNSQICKEQYSSTLGTTTTVTINNGTQVWRLIGEDEKGQPTNIGFGSLTQQLSFDLVGRVTGRKVRYGNEPYIQNAAYEYDVATGNMMMRTDSIYGHEEAFAYDYLNRLTDNGTGGYAYDTKGNVVRRDGVGGYGYSSASPYAVSEVPFNAMIPQRDQRIHYNALQLPDSICEGGTTAIFTYGGDLQRNSMRVTRGETSLSARYYDGTFNSFHRLRGENLDVKQILYLAGDAYTAPAAMVRDYGSGSWQLRHILRDNQGSIVAIADTAGNVLERNDYDPWGVLRQPQTQTPYSPGEAPELLLGRGYCGHEHLTEFGLINMNARLFDPALCRFLSPDPIIQAPNNSQNFNRYSYCLNNPMKYIDKSGCVWKNEVDKILLCHDISMMIFQYQQQLSELFNNSKYKSFKVRVAIYAELKERIKMLQNALEDIEFLDCDPLYYYSLCGITDNSGVANNILFGRIVYIQTYSDNALAVHEISHLANYRRLKCMFSKQEGNYITNPLLKGLSVKLIKKRGMTEAVFKDELDAYKTQFSLCPLSLPVDVQSIYEINRYYVAGLQRNGSFVYFYLNDLLEDSESEK